MKVLIAVSVAAGLAILVAGFIFLNRPQHVKIDASLPADFPATGFPHDRFETLLRRFVDADGYVDYESWHASSASLASLESYLAGVSRFSPDTSPERFANKDEELVYWIQAYNAYVIRTVLDHWPLDSVTDIKAPIEALVKATAGLGFFYRLRFSFGGEYLSLFSVENDRIRKRYKDARVHFVLNCASESCPVIRPELPTGAELEALLSTAATEFVSDRRNVRVDHDAEQLVLSTIFKWFRKDFINDLKLRGLPADDGILAYIASVAPRDMQTDLERAKAYEVVFADYDWDVNATK